MPIVAMPDGAQVSFPDDMPSETIRGMIAAKFPKETGAAPASSFAERFSAVGPYDPNPEARDQGLSRRQAMSGLEQAVSPITEYPEVYDRMNRESRALMSEGVSQAAHPEGIGDVAKGVGKTALGAIGYVASPINAAYRTVVGQPVQDVTGIPREYSEFAAQLATPGIGLTGAAKTTAPEFVSKTVTPTANELKAAAKAGYESDAVKGLDLNPKEVSAAVTGIRSRLDEAGLDDVVASKAHGILKKLEDAPEGAIITGQNLRSVQKTLGKAAGSIDPTEKAGAMVALKEFNNFLENVPTSSVMRGSAEDFVNAVKPANANYSAAKTSDMLDARVAAKKLSAEAQNSGMNVGAKIRNDMATIVNNPRPGRGMRPDEIAQARQIAEGTPGVNLIRKAGNLMGGGGGLGSVVAAGVAGAGAGGPVGIATPIGGMLLRGLSNRMTLSKAQKLSETIRSRAPLSSATAKFEERAAQFRQARNTQTAAAAALAARNLSTNLKDAGIDIPTTDLMRLVTANGQANQDE